MDLMTLIELSTTLHWVAWSLALGSVLCLLGDFAVRRWVTGGEGPLDVAVFESKYVKMARAERRRRAVLDAVGDIEDWELSEQVLRELVTAGWLKVPGKRHWIATKLTERSELVVWHVAQLEPARGALPPVWSFCVEAFQDLSRTTMAECLLRYERTSSSPGTAYDKTFAALRADSGKKAADARAAGPFFTP